MTSNLEARIKRLEAQPAAEPEAWRVVRPADLEGGAMVLEGKTYRDSHTGDVLRRVIRVIRENTTGAATHEH